MMPKEIDEKELQEILELAKESERKARAMCEIITNHSAKYRRWYEEANAEEPTLLKQSSQE